jgi:hypothetical protein
MITIKVRYCGRVASDRCKDCVGRLYVNCDDYSDSLCELVHATELLNRSIIDVVKAIRIVSARFPELSPDALFVGGTDRISGEVICNAPLRSDTLDRINYSIGLLNEILDSGNAIQGIGDMMLNDKN